jgi:HSP20 family molecular chaperone IbpA
MSTRTLLFDSPFLLGFEHTRNQIERAAKAANEGYPPYNVEAQETGTVRISLAVAGFSPEQLEVLLEGRQLTIIGRREPSAEAADRAFLHRGIAARGFVKAFVLADGMEVADALLEHGLLHIDLYRPEPTNQIFKVPIRTS